MSNCYEIFTIFIHMENWFFNGSIMIQTVAFRLWLNQWLNLIYGWIINESMVESHLWLNYKWLDYVKDWIMVSLDWVGWYLCSSPTQKSCSTHAGTHTEFRQRKTINTLENLQLRQSEKQSKRPVDQGTLALGLIGAGFAM